MGGIVNPPVIPPATPPTVGVTTVVGSQTDSLWRQDAAGLLACDQLFAAVVTGGVTYTLQIGGYGLLPSPYMTAQTAANQSAVSTGLHVSRSVKIQANSTSALAVFATNAKAANVGYSGAATEFEIDTITGDPVNFKTAGSSRAGYNSGGLFNSNATRLISSSVNLNDGAGIAAGTLLNAPAAGDPTKWIPVNDNGTIRYIPAW